MMENSNDKSFGSFLDWTASDVIEWLQSLSLNGNYQRHFEGDNNTLNCRFAGEYILVSGQYWLVNHSHVPCVFMYKRQWRRNVTCAHLFNNFYCLTENLIDGKSLLKFNQTLLQGK